MILAACAAIAAVPAAVRAADDPAPLLGFTVESSRRRHLVYAPLPSYVAETLPGVREAVVAGDAGGAARQAAVLADAIRRVADRLKAPQP